MHLRPTDPQNVKKPGNQLPSDPAYSKNSIIRLENYADLNESDLNDT